MTSDSKTSSEFTRVGGVSNHHNEDYWNWQKNTGAVGGWANRHKFEDAIDRGDCVIDFGCGGGYLLANLRCAKRIGVEPNMSARQQLGELGIQHFRSSIEVIESLGLAVADAIISNHALEHVLNPLQELRELHNLLKPGGTILFFVPCESVRRKYSKSDIDRHLFS